LRRRPAIVAQFEKGGLLAFGLLPSLKLLAAQGAKALPAKGASIDHQNIGL